MKERVINFERQHQPHFHTCFMCGKDDARMYIAKIGSKDEAGENTMSIPACELCLDILRERIWYIAHKRQSQVFTPSSNKEMPKCCGDCKEIKCRLPYDANNVYVIEPYLAQKVHEKCPLEVI